MIGLLTLIPAAGVVSMSPYTVVAACDLGGDGKRGIREELQVSVAVKVVDVNDLNRLPSRPLDLDVYLRPGFPQQPVQTRGHFLGVESERFKLDLDEIEKVEVLRGPGTALIGRDAISGIINVVTKGLDEDVEAPKQIDPMVGLQPNGWTDWSLSYRYRDVFAATKFDRVTFEDMREIGRETVYQKDILYGTVLQPETPKANFEKDGDVWGGASLGYLDRIGGVRFTAEYEQKLGIPGLPIAPFGLTGSFRTPILSGPASYFRSMSNALGRPFIDDLLSKSGLQAPFMNELMIGVAAQGEDMNRLQFPGDPEIANDIECGSDVMLPPGTFWMPDRPGYQGMTNIVGLRHTFSPLNLSVDGGSVSELRTHCLNMGLKEPEKGVRYYPYASSDPILSKLADIAGQSRFRGPWDQARTWIYTDKASFADLNKRLVPPITEGRYVNALFDVASLGGLNDQDYKSKGLFGPALLLAPTASDVAFNWFAAHITREFETEVSAWIERSKSDLSKLAGGDEYDQKHLIRFLRSMIGCGSSKVRLAVLQFVNESGPIGGRLKDKIGDLRRAMISDNNSEVALAIDVCEKYQTVRPMLLLRYLAERGGTPAIKAKAASLLGS